MPSETGKDLILNFENGKYIYCLSILFLKNSVKIDFFCCWIFNLCLIFDSTETIRLFALDFYEMIVS